VGNIDTRRARGLAVLCGSSCVFFSIVGVAMNFLTYGGDVLNVVFVSGMAVFLSGVVNFFVAVLVKQFTPLKIGLVSISGFAAMCYWVNVMLVGPFCLVGKIYVVDQFFLGLAAVCNIAWCWLVARGFFRVFNSDKLRGIVYKDRGDCYVYRAKSHEVALEKVGVAIPPPWFFFVLSPLLYVTVFFCVIVGGAGQYGLVQVLLAGIALPLSMVFNAALVVCILMHGVFPYRLNKITGKTVIFDF